MSADGSLPPGVEEHHVSGNKPEPDMEFCPKCEFPLDGTEMTANMCDSCAAYHYYKLYIHYKNLCSLKNG